MATQVEQAMQRVKMQLNENSESANQGHVSVHCQGHLRFTQKKTAATQLGQAMQRVKMSLDEKLCSAIQKVMARDILSPIAQSPPLLRSHFCSQPHTSPMIPQLIPCFSHNAKRQQAKRVQAKQMHLICLCCVDLI